MKNKHILLLLIALMSCFFLVECSKEDCSSTCLNNDTQPDAIIPLAYGNNWIYNVYSYDTTGKLTDINFSDITVISDSTINNQQWYKYYDDDFFRMNTTGGYYLGYYDSTGFKKFLMFKYSAVAGDTFTVYVPTGSYLFKVDSVNASVTVPAGTFSCIKYIQSENINSLKEYIYCAPKVGLIKIENYSKTFSSTPVLHTKMELKAYTLK